MDYQKAIEVINNHERYVGVKYVNSVEEAYVTPYFEKALDTAISAMQELQEYRKLGTLEEVREAVERQHAKKPSLMLGIYGRVYECKECGNELEMYSKYCPLCGQKQNWE